MRGSRRARLVAGVTIVTLLAAPVAFADEAEVPADAAAEADYAAGRAIVGTTSRRDVEVTEESIEAEGGEVVSYDKEGKFFVVATPEDSLAWAEDVEGDAKVRYAEPDYEVSIDLEPDDPSFLDDTLWGLEKIEAPGAWEHSTGESDVVVGVIDTGIDYTHPELASQMWTNPGEVSGAAGVDDDGNGWVDDIHGIDCRNEDGDPTDDNGHGTHVAGTIGAEGNNETGVTGVNWDVSLMALKFLNASGTGSTSDAVQCLDYATEQGVDLTNNSWGGGGFSQALSDAIDRAGQEDRLVVAAAGNNARDTDVTPFYPAAYGHDNVISVAATGTADELADFSNFGPESVDLAAPGVSIVSTVPGGGYASASGTSMATPHVSGAAALLIAFVPELGRDFSALRDHLLQGVDEVPSLSGKVDTEGRLNIDNSVDGTIDLAPSVSVTSPAPGAVIRGSTALAATALDDEGVQSVRFYAGSALIGVDSTEGDGWSATWNTAASPDGNYSIVAVATDTAAQETTSGVIPVRVDNIKTMHVHDLDATGTVTSSTTWKATVTISIGNEAEAGVPRAQVKVAWSGGKSGGTSCITNSAGQCTVTLTRLSRRTVASVTATVTAVTVRGLRYDSLANHNPDGDAGNGTAISIVRP